MARPSEMTRIGRRPSHRRPMGAQVIGVKQAAHIVSDDGRIVIVASHPSSLGALTSCEAGNMRPLFRARTLRRHNSQK
jgi:hypothetical protein